MKGIILAGGTGSRLFPLTKVTNKHLIPVGNVPMIYHPLKKLREIGIDEICIVTGVEHMGDVVTLLGSGKDFGCKFTYKVQDEAGGIAQALSLTENFVGGHLMCVILGDNIFEGSLKPAVSDFIYSNTPLRGMAHVLLKSSPDPERFGVAEVKNEMIVSLEEKPKQPKSNLIVTGIYFYDHEVFDVIRTLKPSARGELEITDVNNYYLKQGKLNFTRLQGYWTDAGTFESLRLANHLVTSDYSL